jgi:hypothetical protein
MAALSFSVEFIFLFKKIGLHKISKKQTLTFHFLQTKWSTVRPSTDAATFWNNSHTNTRKPPFWLLWKRPKHVVS